MARLGYGRRAARAELLGCRTPAASDPDGVGRSDGDAR